MTRAYLADPDFTLYVGDVRDVLANLPDESVDCCITSPPYWGLRDYGTGSWDGGDPACDHLGQPFRTKSKLNENWGAGFSDVKNAEGREPMGQTCSKCGARRVDRQLGLEATPDEYVANMVAVFREVRRVLAPHGTCWVDLGDSYCSQPNQRVQKPGGRDDVAGWKQATNNGSLTQGSSYVLGLKPKDLIGLPWMVAFALRADGWWLRSEIIWAKPNPMPESVTDRPTKSHEQVFLLAKRASYWFDQEAVREPSTPASVARHGGPQEQPFRHGRMAGDVGGQAPHEGTLNVNGGGANGRNVRSVWEIATQPFPEAHFATYPQELVRRCLLAGCPSEVCGVCGKPRERTVDVAYDNPGNRRTNGPRSVEARDDAKRATVNSRGSRLERRAETTGWTDCGHNAYRPGIVLDPFLGSGTTALVAREQGRHCVGIELSEEYAAMAARRLSQLSLLADGAA